jgi:hypothetical protein
MEMRMFRWCGMTRMNRISNEYIKGSLLNDMRIKGVSMETKSDRRERKKKNVLTPFNGIRG